MKLGDSISDYDRFVNHSSAGNIFQSREYYEVLSKIRWNPFVLTVLDGKKCCGGLLAYSPISIPVASRLFHMTFIYLGPVVRNNDDRVLELILERLILKAKQMGAVRLDLRTPYQFPQQYKIFREQDFKRHYADGEYSILIDLTKGKDELWSEVSKTFRKRIRKALKEGVQIKKIETIEELYAFYQIYLDTSRRRSFFPYPFAFFKELWSTFEPKRLAQFLIAVYKKQVIGGMINMTYKGKVTTFISGSLKRFWNLNPNHALQWYSIVHSIEDLHAHVFDIFHLSDTKPDSRNRIDYYTFKTGFGGSLVRESLFHYKITSRLRHSVFKGITGFSGKLIQHLARERHYVRAQ